MHKRANSLASVVRNICIELILIGIIGTIAVLIYYTATK